MKFRDTLAADRDVFLCPEEFAEIHKINGKDCISIVQQVSADAEYSTGSGLETKQYYDLYGSHVQVHCKTEGLDKVPVYGQKVWVDGALYLCAESKIDLGIVTLVLVANTR